jgi:hypothetical protein
MALVASGKEAEVGMGAVDRKGWKRRAVAVATVAAYLVVTLGVGLCHAGQGVALHHSALFHALAGEGLRPPCEDCAADGESLRTVELMGHGDAVCLACLLLHARSLEPGGLAGYLLTLPPGARLAASPGALALNPLAHLHLSRSPPLPTA